VLVRNAVPPVSAAYHLKVPVVALVAESATVPAAQRDAPAGVGATAAVFTVAVTAFLGVLSHVPLLKVT
jgi:hypothetical protein